jgi:hypothetical protein
VQYEDEIEKQGYTVENNKLVKLSKSYGHGIFNET